MGSSDVSFVTVTVKSFESDKEPSLTEAVRLYILSESASEGISKSGAVEKVTTPEVLIANNEESVPEIVYVSESLSASVAVTVKAEV